MSEAEMIFFFQGTEVLVSRLPTLFISCLTTQFTGDFTAFVVYAVCSVTALLGVSLLSGLEVAYCAHNTRLQRIIAANRVYLG